VALEVVRHVHAREDTGLAEIGVLGEQRHAQMRRTLRKAQHMVQELIGVLPRFVLLENGIQDLLLALLALLAANVLWRHDLGIHIQRIVIEYDDLVDAEDGAGARDAAHEERLVVGLLGVVEPGAGEGDAEGPGAAGRGLEDCSGSRSVNVNVCAGLHFAFPLLWWAVGALFLAILVDDYGWGFALLMIVLVFVRFWDVTKKEAFGFRGSIVAGDCVEILKSYSFTWFCDTITSAIHPISAPTNTQIFPAYSNILSRSWLTFPCPAISSTAPLFDRALVLTTMVSLSIAIAPSFLPYSFDDISFVSFASLLVG
jgi:hypothetical protein